MMRTPAFLAALALAAPPFASAAAQALSDAPSPTEIVEAASAEEWTAIPSENLLVMTLAPDRDGNPREVVIQLIDAPFSQKWVENVRALAKAHWYDGTSVNRVQDNYVVQWGDATEEKPLPQGLNKPAERDYTTAFVPGMFGGTIYHRGGAIDEVVEITPRPARQGPRPNSFADAYADATGFANGFPAGMRLETSGGYPIVQRPTVTWPIHCYASVGVGRGLSPDTGTGAELYTVIGHAPRHLDRNIAVVGRVIEGIEHLSSLPRGTGPLGFYEDPAQRVPIVSIRLASELAQAARPRFEYLATDSASFAAYADRRANREGPFFVVPGGGADICNIPVPVRRTAAR